MSTEECAAREANVLTNTLKLSVTELQNEIQTTHLLTSIAQNPRFVQPEEEAAAARQTQHESLLYRQRIQWDQFGSSSIAFVPPGPPHELTNFASEVSCGSQDVTQVCGTQADSDGQNNANNEDDTTSLLTQRATRNSLGPSEVGEEGEEGEESEYEVVDTFTYLECYACLQTGPDCTCTAYGAAPPWPDET
jgi:hypothetical protein